MLNIMLKQQDDYFFKDGDRLSRPLNWITTHRDALRVHGNDARRRGRLSTECVDLLRSGEMFDLALSSDQGGLGLTSAAQVRVLEELATIDAGISWCVMIGMDSGIYRGFIGPISRDRYFPHPRLISAGWIHPQGTAVDLGDGTRRVSGRWQFGSGIDHADVVLAGVKYMTAHKPDEWLWRIAIIDLEHVEIEATWNTWGLQGSGSQHYRATDVIIPIEHTFSLHEPKLEGPMYQPHDGILRKMAGVPLGTAGGALLAVVDRVREKNETIQDSGGNTNDRVLNAVARLTGDLLAIRAAVYSTLQSAWHIYEQSPASSAECDPALVAAAVLRQRAFQTSRSIVLDAYDLLGAQAVYRDAGDVGARLSDLNVIAQHAVGQESLLDSAGARILGGNAVGPFL